MAAKDVVLGLVVERADYGYSLARRFDERFGDSRFAESSIYAAPGLTQAAARVHGRLL